MNEHEAIEMATQLLKTHGDQGFEISMPDQAGYELMKRTFKSLGRDAGPDGEFFVVSIPPREPASDDSSGDPKIPS